MVLANTEIQVVIIPVEWRRFLPALVIKTRNTRSVSNNWDFQLDNFWHASKKESVAKVPQERTQ